MGYSDKLDPKQPYINVIAKTNFLFFWEPLALQAEFGYMRHIPKKEKNPAIEELTAETNNFMIGGFALFDFYFFDDFGIHPKIGGGFVIQSSKVSGEINDSLNNAFPFIGAGMEFSYSINRFIKGVLVLQNYMEIEKGTITHLYTASLGVDFKF